MGVRAGCSPGFWGRNQHLHHWKATGFNPHDSFNAVFGRNVFLPSVTLLQAINPNPPMNLLKQLARQGVAALLNAAHPSINYSITQSQVITLFQNAFDSCNFEETKDLFQCYNELFCPLN